MSRFALRSSLLAVSGLLLACGGGGSDDITPPPQPGPPASIAVSQGDGQQGEPGAILTTRPAVVVRDASARAVPGVVVNFGVDSGGGAIASGQATTGTDGVATAGNWTLGATEGRNTLLVTAASLAPVRLGATARLADVPIGQGTGTPAGGTITVTAPSSPLNGFSITIPDAAFSAPVSFTVRQSSSAGFSLTQPGQAFGGSARSVSAMSVAAANGAGAAATPVITIVSNGPATANGELLLRIPVPAGTVRPLAAVVNASGTPLAFLPIIARDATSITVTTRVLDPALFSQVGNIPQTTPPPHALSIVLFNGPAGGPGLGQQFPIAFSSDYRFGKSNFAFNAVSTTRDPRTEIGVALTEWAATFLFPGGVHHTFDRAPGVTFSDTRGLSMSAGITGDAFQSLGSYAAAWMAHYKTQNVAYDADLATAIIYQMWYSGRSVPVWLTDGQYMHMVLVIGWDPAQERFLTREPASGVMSHLSFAGDVMATYPDPVSSSVQYTIPYMSYAWQAGYWPQLQSYVSSLASATTPEVFPFRAARFGTRGSALLRATPDQPDSIFFLADTNRVWPTTQAPRYAPPSNFPANPGWGNGYGRFYDRTESGIWSPAPGTEGSSAFFDWTAFPQGHAQTIGLEVLEFESSQFPYVSWAGWREIRLIKYGLKVAGTFEAVGGPSTFTPSLLAGSPQLPAGAKFEWDFGDNTAKQVVTSLTAVNHTYAASGTYDVVLQVLHPVQNLPIARATISGSVEGEAVWHILTFIDQDDFFKDLEVGEAAEWLLRIKAVPLSSVISIERYGAADEELRLTVLLDDVWNPAICCPPASGGTAFVVPLGPRLPFHQSFGPFFSAWQTSSFTMTGSIQSGTLVSLYAFPPPIPYTIPGQGVQTGPSGAIRVNAVMNGNMLTGTILLTSWWIDDEFGELDSEGTYRFPFTARRMPYSAAPRRR